jgi:hypothetical protein
VLLLILYIFISPIVFGIVFPGGAGREGGLLFIGVIFVSTVASFITLLSIFIVKKILENYQEQLILIVSILVSSYFLYHLIFFDSYWGFRKSYYISYAVCIAVLFVFSFYKRKAP